MKRASQLNGDKRTGNELANSIEICLHILSNTFKINDNNEINTFKIND